MNILTDKLPAGVMIDGKKYRVNTDFRTGLKIINYAEKYSGVRLLIYALKTFYVEMPEDIALAIEGMKKFYHGESGGSEGNGKKLFSFEKDAEYIFSSFYTQYGINLAQDDMHWYVFSALLKGLCGENAFSKLLEIRTLDVSEIRDDKHRTKLERLKHKYSLEKMSIDEGLRRVF